MKNKNLDIMKNFTKALFSLLLLSVITNSSKAQWTPCPTPICLEGTITNNTTNNLEYVALFPGSSQCSNDVVFTPPPLGPSISYSIEKHKCIDGPCVCPIGLKLVELALPNIYDVNTLTIANYTPPITINLAPIILSNGNSINITYIYNSPTNIDIIIN